MAAVDGGSKVSHREKCHGDRNGVSTNGHAACLMALGILESAQVAEKEEKGLGEERPRAPEGSGSGLQQRLPLHSSWVNRAIGRRISVDGRGWT